MGYNCFTCEHIKLTNIDAINNNREKLLNIYLENYSYNYLFWICKEIYEDKKFRPNLILILDGSLELKR